MKGDKVIGLDYGTLSARAVIVSCVDGQVLGEHVFQYPHAVITERLPGGEPIDEGWAFAAAEDYRSALRECICGVMQKAAVDKDEISGIGIAATTYTMVPCLSDGTVLSELDEFKSEAMAYIKLWKHRGAKHQAEKIQRMHDTVGAFPVLERYGGAANCEWALPKLLETYELSPQVFAKADRFCDLGEWIALLLTGKPVNSLYTAGFKGVWAQDIGYPSPRELDALSPGFSAAFKAKFAGDIIGYDRPCGFLSESMARELGLNPGIAVAAPMGDGSLPGVYFCINNPKALAITVGTSIAMAFTTDTLKAISGINGVVKDGIVPGAWSYDAGQPCAGDMLGWFCENTLPERYSAAARDRGESVFEYLNALASPEPWNNTLSVLDWWNGNRSILNDMSLKGAVLGLTLGTGPEEIYCAMVQGLASSIRKIIEYFADNGIEFDKVILCGGIPLKNRFLGEQFASILHRPLLVSSQKQITAIAAAMLVSMATGRTAQETAAHMASEDYEIVAPDMAHAMEYDAIYKRWEYFHDLLGKHSVTYLQH